VPGAPLKDLAAPVRSDFEGSYARLKLLILQWLPPRDSLTLKEKWLRTLLTLVPRFIPHVVDVVGDHMAIPDLH
jgi:hypothetical protein